MKFKSLILISAVLLFAGSANAVPIVCDATAYDAIANDDGNPNNDKFTDSSIDILGSSATIVTTNCGPHGGNDETNLSATNGGYGFDDWLLLAKDETGPGAINLTVTGGGGVDTTGTFSFKDIGYESYLIVLKFDGVYSTFLSDSATYLSGDTEVFWDWNTDVDGDGVADLSHLTIYGRNLTVPEPGMIGLLAIGLIGVVVARRRMKV